MIRRAMLIAAALLSFAALIAGAAPAQASSSYVWIYPKGALASADSTVYNKLVNGTGQTVYQVVNPSIAGTCPVTGTAPPLTGSNPALIGTTHAYSGNGVTATSLNSSLLSGTTAVLLDQESWCQTSPADHADPYGNDQTIASAAVQDGLTFLTAPALDLFTCPGSQQSCLACPPGVPAGITCSSCPPGSASWVCYEDYDIAGWEALHANVIDIQAQTLETSSNWNGFVGDTIDQAKDANPNVTVLVGLTNKPTLKPAPTETTLENDLTTALNDGASGAWINEDAGGSSQLMDNVVCEFIC